MNIEPNAPPELGFPVPSPYPPDPFVPLWTRPPSHDQLRDEFERAFEQRAPEHVAYLEHHGIGLMARNRAGDIGADRITISAGLYHPHPQGDPAFILPVWLPGPPSLAYAAESHWIADLLAFDPAYPDRWWYRQGERGLILGAHNHAQAARSQTPALIAENPVAWLRGLHGAGRGAGNGSAPVWDVDSQYYEPSPPFPAICVLGSCHNEAESWDHELRAAS